MMQTEKPNEPAQDAQCVSAVCRGEVERYRELVERHERRVFAVAWSRLGDAALAEEATQEAFIRGYRQLWGLGDGAKFAGWIMAIARNAAINLGLKHRRELNKRARWALEQAPTPEPAGGEPAAPCTPELLRQTLEELPAAHRECLVLFYLQGKSGAEAAAALGLSEAAFRVRLHRARGVLREHLEARLESALQDLRPAQKLVPAIMAAVLSSTSAKAVGGTAGVGAGAKMLSALGKTSLFSWLAPCLSLLGALPGLLVALWVGKLEQRNYREPEGFRAQLYQRFLLSYLWGFPLLLLLMGVWTRAANAAWGYESMAFSLAGLVAWLTLLSARSLLISCNPFQIGMAAYSAIIGVGIWAVALGWLPRSLGQVPMVVATILFIFVLKYRPLRMDYSLLLRAAQGMLSIPTDSEAKAASTQAMARRELLAFGRFLGARYLVNNYRWQTGGLVLQLPPVKSSFAASMLSIFRFPLSARFSRVVFGWDGTVRALCSRQDLAELSGMSSGGRIEIQALETRVAVALEEAWREFRAGQLAAAERSLGQLPESAVFVVSPARARSTRMLQGFLSVLVLLLIGCLTAPLWLPGRWRLAPVAASEAEVRAFMSHLKRDKGFKHVPPESSSRALISCLVLPPTNLFSADALRVMREDVFGMTGVNPEHVSFFSLHGSWLLHKAMTRGWISWNDLGLKPQEVTEHFHHLNTNQWRFMLASRMSWSWVKQERGEVTRIDELTLAQLCWLREVNCLDLVDREGLIRQIAVVQVLSAKPLPGQPTIPNWRSVRGLFFTPGWPALQDTYFSLAALEILGGLDRIDREACIAGILRRHRGKGCFDSPAPGGYNEYKIRGDAHDTFCAFESLRILGALDRVKDLERWQFRPARFSREPSAPKMNWYVVEAWVCQQRLERILRERKADSQAAVKSLLEP